MSYDDEYWFGLSNLKKEFPNRPVEELQACLDKYRIDPRAGNEEQDRYHVSAGCEFLCAQFELNYPEKKVHLSKTGLAWVLLEEGEGDKIKAIPTKGDGHKIKIIWEGFALSMAKLHKFKDEGEDVVHLKERRTLSGWLEAIEDMKIGEKRAVMVPPHLGFGSAYDVRKWGISENDSCQFNIKILEIVPPRKKEEVVTTYFFNESGVAWRPRIEHVPLKKSWQPSYQWKASPDFKPPEDWGLPPDWKLNIRPDGKTGV